MHAGLNDFHIICLNNNELNKFSSKKDSFYNVCNSFEEFIRNSSIFIECCQPYGKDKLSLYKLKYFAS